MRKQLIKFYKEKGILILIVFLAAALRLAFPNTPPALNWDEISHGYNAYSILKSGRDEWGSFLPIIFRAYGDYKLPAYIYLTAISEFFFGLTTFAVRFTSILAGIGTVVFTYLLTKVLFENNSGSDSKFFEGLKTETVSLISALLVAVEPWSFFLSRAAFEANLGLFLFVAGIYFFFKSLKNSFAGRGLYCSLIFLGLTVWAYNSYRIFTPLILIILFFIYRKVIFQLFTRDIKKVYLSIILATIFFVPMFWQLLGQSGQARYSWVSIIDSGAIAQIENARSNSTLGYTATRLLYNRPVFFLTHFIKNWSLHYHPSFLFFNGGSNYQFSVPGAGILFPLDIPFIIFGIYLLLKGVWQKSKSFIFLSCWLLLAPIPSSLTREAPHVLREITILPVPMIISALGFSALIKKLGKSANLLGIIVLILLLFISTVPYYKKYFIDYRIGYSEAWQFGYKEIYSYTKNEYSKYDKIIITKKYGEPHEFLLYYWPWDPIKYRQDPYLNRFYQSNWYWNDGFDKFYFVNDWQINDKNTGSFAFMLESKKLVDCTPGKFKCLLITSPGNVPDGWKKAGYTNFLDGKPAFEIYEN